MKTPWEAARTGPIIWTQIIRTPTSMTTRFSLGIDLGTSNSAMALTDIDSDRTEIVPITQILAANQIGEKPTLPSALYLPHPDEFRPGSFPLPWDDSGEPGSSANSPATTARWCPTAWSLRPNPGCPTRISIRSSGRCPGSPISRRRSSRRSMLAPVPGASQGRLPPRRARPGPAVGPRRRPDRADRPRLLRRSRAKPDGGSGGGRGSGQGHVAGGAAGGVLRLDRAGRPEWRDAVAPGDIILVCDVGGGTADFSLIAVTDDDGDLELERISVGEHILLGGDNMDLALAYTLRARFEAEGKSLDAWQFLALVHAASQAKITLFEDETPGGSADRRAVARLQPVCQDDLHGARSRHAVAGRPRRFLRPDRARRSAAEARRTGPAGIRPALRVRSRDQQASGPLPHAQPAECEGERQARRAGRRRGPAGRRSCRRPCCSMAACSRPRRSAPGCWSCWRRGTAGKPVRELEGFEPDLAVAQGAAVYGRHRATGKGMRIKAGAARSYYVGLETSMPAVPGFRPPVKALCVVPQGMEEGTEHTDRGARHSAW